MGEDRTDEVMALLDEIKAIVDRHGGKLPGVQEAPELYSKILAFLDIAREEGVKITIKEIADRLGVSYALLRKRLHDYRKMESKPGEEPVATAAPAPVETIPPAMAQPEEPQTDTGGEDQITRPGEPITTRTAMRIMEAVKRHLGKKAEHLAKEEVERIIKMGVHIYESFEKQCYSNGYDDVIKCIDDAFDTLFNQLPECVELARKYDVLRELFQFVVDSSDDYKRMLMLLEEVKYKMSPEEVLELVEEVVS